MNQDFKNWAVGQGSVPTPANTYLGECVSLIQQYLSRVYGIPFQPRGHAKDWATNANVLSNFDKVDSPQAGDIGVSGATATNPYGHIWIYLSPNQILEQNGRVSRRVSVGTPYLRPIAILRRKGGNPPEGDNVKKSIPPEIVAQHYANFTAGLVRVNANDPAAQNRFEDTDDDEFWYGLCFQLKDLLNGQFHRAEGLQTELENERKGYDQQIADLKKQLEESSGDSKFKKVEVYVKEA